MQCLQSSCGRAAAGSASFLGHSSVPEFKTRCKLHELSNGETLLFQVLDVCTLFNALTTSWEAVGLSARHLESQLIFQLGREAFLKCTFLETLHQQAGFRRQNTAMQASSWLRWLRCAATFERPTRTSPRGRKTLRRSLQIQAPRSCRFWDLFWSCVGWFGFGAFVFWPFGLLPPSMCSVSFPSTMTWAHRPHGVRTRAKKLQELLSPFPKCECKTHVTTKTHANQAERMIRTVKK